MSRGARIALVMAGYLGAAVCAWALTAAYIWATAGPDRDTYQGMFAFGDTMVFLAAFAVVATVPTGLVLYRLRRRRALWGWLAGVALLVAVTALLADASYIADATPGAQPRFYDMGALAPLRILLAPLLALYFVESGLFAPSRGPRAALLAAAIVEVLSFGYIVVVFFLPALRA
jgi:hypothetical protein